MFPGTLDSLRSLRTGRQIGLRVQDPAPILALWEVGYRLEALEMPANTQERRIVIDCVAFHAPSNRFFLAEGKSGGIQAEQAARYGTVDQKELVRTIGVTITAWGSWIVT